MNKLRPAIVMGLALLALACTVAPLGAQNHTPPIPVAGNAVGFNPVVNYNYDNFAYSPNIRKFVDSLPGLGLAGCSIPSGRNRWFLQPEQPRPVSSRSRLDQEHAL